MSSMLDSIALGSLTERRLTEKPSYSVECLARCNENILVMKSTYGCLWWSLWCLRWSLLKGNGCWVKTWRTESRIWTGWWTGKDKRLHAWKLRRLKEEEKMEMMICAHDGKDRWGFDSRELCWRKEPGQQVLLVPWYLKANGNYKEF